MNEQEKKILAECIRSLMVDEKTVRGHTYCRCSSCGAKAYHLFLDNDHEDYCPAMNAVKMLEGGGK